MKNLKIIVSLVVSILSISGCSTNIGITSPNVNKPLLTPGNKENSFKIQFNSGEQTITCSENSFTINNDAPFGTFSYANSIPDLEGLNINFKLIHGKKDRLPDSNNVYFQDSQSFEVILKEGLVLRVTDNDARDGQVTIEVPAGNYDLFTGISGKRGGNIEVEDPMYFMKGSDFANKGKKDWINIGLRSFLNPLKLKFKVASLNEFKLRMFPTNLQASLPPQPPVINSLTAPREAYPGLNVNLSANAVDPNAEQLTYSWSVTDSNNITNPLSGNNNLSWKASFKAETFKFNLSVKDSYHTTTFCQPVEIKIPNISPEGSLSGENGQALPDKLNPGEELKIIATGKDDNQDTLSWRWETTGGTLSNTTGETVVFKAPGQSGSYIITGYLNDGNGFEVPVSYTVTVLEAVKPEIELPGVTTYSETSPIFMGNDVFKGEGWSNGANTLSTTVIRTFSSVYNVTEIKIGFLAAHNIYGKKISELKLELLRPDNTWTVIKTEYPNYYLVQNYIYKLPVPISAKALRVTGRDYSNPNGAWYVAPNYPWVVKGTSL